MHSYATWRQSAHSGDSRSRAKAKRSKRSSLSIWRIHKPVNVAFGKTTGRSRPAQPAVQQRSSGNGGENSFGDLETRCPQGRLRRVALGVPPCVTTSDEW